MDDAPNNRSAQQLVAMALGTPEQATLSSAPQNAHDERQQSDLPVIFAPSLQTEEAIELYFLAETPEERDAAFTALTKLEAPEISAFFAAMMAHDEDPYLRVSAAFQLLRRGFDEARAYLVQNVVHAPDDIVFEQALAALLSCGGPTMFGPLEQIWRDTQRDRAERLAAMQGLEQVDPPRALASFERHLNEYADLGALDLEELGVALTAFARHIHRPAAALIATLRARARTESFDDPLDREALLSVLDEGAAVLEAAIADAGQQEVSPAEQSPR